MIKNTLLPSEYSEIMEHLYYDCNVNNRTFISSSFTPHGIHCIDTEYCRRIQNICKPVLKLIKIERKPHYRDGEYESDFWDEYTELSLDEDYHNYDRIVFIHNQNNPYIKMPTPEYVVEFFKKYPNSKSIFNYQTQSIIETEYCYTYPTYLASHKGENPENLKKEIEENTHLHKLIKENLLDNLHNYIKCL